MYPPKRGLTPERCSRASCSATSGGRSPARTARYTGASSRRAAAHCSSTRSRGCPRRSSRRSCGSWSTARSPASAGCTSSERSRPARGGRVRRGAVPGQGGSVRATADSTCAGGIRRQPGGRRPSSRAGLPQVPLLLPEVPLNKAEHDRGKVPPRYFVWMNGSGRRPPEHSIGAFDDRIELENPGHGAAKTATFACPPECRNCRVPNGAVEAREEEIVPSRVCGPASRACQTTRVEASAVLAGSNRRPVCGAYGMWHAMRRTRRRVPAIGDL